MDRLTVTRVGNISGLSIGVFAADGDVSLFLLMANVLYDFDVGLPVTPFVMGGIGTVLVLMNDVKSLGVDIADDDAWVFAYQFGFGASYDMGNH